MRRLTMSQARHRRPLETVPSVRAGDEPVGPEVTYLSSYRRRSTDVGTDAECYRNGAAVVRQGEELRASVSDHYRAR